MTSNSDSGSGSSTTRSNSRVGELLSGWQATRAQTVLATHLVDDRDEYLATESRDIGRAVGENLRELFVSCDPAPAMLQQFDHAQPDFIAVHDIGTTSSRKLLAGVAEAMGVGISRLMIRRQGYGTTLATLEYIEFPGTEGGTLRVYSTEAEADTASRQGLARVLLAYSRLGVLMVGDLPGHALAKALKPLRDDIITGPWPNRDLLLLPLASSAATASHGGDLGRGTGITVRTTPAVLRPSDAWTFISGAWGRLRAQIADTGKLVPAIPGMSIAAPTAAGAPPAPSAATAQPAGTPFGPHAVTPALEPLSLRPMPPVPQKSSHVAALSPAASGLLARYVEQLSKLNGMLECCVFESASGRDIAHVGGKSDVDSLASAGAALLGSLVRTSQRLKLAAKLPEAAITLDDRHLILRPVPTHPTLMLHAVLDKSRCNLTLARLQIQRMDELFDASPP